MMNPEMMKMASEMMSKMTPEQMAAVQRQMANMPPEMMSQAMNMAQNATPEQMNQMRAAASGMSGDTIASSAGVALEQLTAQQKYQVDAAAQLKAEGNRLHGSKLYREAAVKYERAVSNLEGQASPQARQLRTSCQSNLASCFLQLEQWPQCVEMCGAVLGADPANRKALYRRGQALCALGQYAGAVEDLRQAVKLSPESEKEIIREKLAEAKQGLRHATQGVVIEEVTEPATAAASQQQPQQAQQPREGLAESDTDDEMPAGLYPPEAAVARSGGAASMAAAAAAMPAGGVDAARMKQQATEMLKTNPDVARQAAEAMAGMSDAQIASMCAQSGMPGITPDMAKQAAAMMRTMPPDQLAAMAAASASAGGLGGMPGFPAAAPAMPSPVAMAAAAGAGTGAAAGTGDSDQMRAAADAMRQNPAMMKQAAAMMENMPEEQLAAMASAMPGPPGMKVDAAQMKMAAKMMATMSPADMERMTQMAAAMQGGGAAVGGMGSGGMGAMGASPALAAGGSGAAAATSTAAAAAVPGMAGMPAGFDPSNMPAGMMSDMRKRMQDPEMLKMMKGMLKGMDPEGLSEMMKQSGMNVTPQQARSMVDKLDGVSDKHLELIARLMGWVNGALDAYRRAKAWALSQGALMLALLVLVVALLLRWLGWI